MSPSKSPCPRRTPLRPPHPRPNFRRRNAADFADGSKAKTHFANLDGLIEKFDDAKAGQTPNRVSKETLLAARSEIAALMFSQRLFTLDPALRARLRQDIDELGEEFIHTLREVVGNLDRPAKLRAHSPSLNRTVIGGLETWRDETFRAALLWMLEHNLGPAFTRDVREAWTALLADLAAVRADSQAEHVCPAKRPVPGQN